MKYLNLAVLAGLICFGSFNESKAQENDEETAELKAVFTVGDTITVADTLQTVQNPNYATTSVKNKVLVLDFWFMACGPCVYSIPHLNDLSSVYDSSQVAFISVTFDNAADLRDFIAQKELRSMVVSDPAKDITAAYGISGYPETFLIDNKGIIRWKGNPMMLSRSMIDSLAGINRYGQVLPSEERAVTEKGMSSFSFEMNPRTDNSGGRGRIANAGELSFANYRVKDLLSQIYQLPPNRIQTESDERYDFRLKMERSAEGMDVRPGILADQVMAELNIQARWDSLEAGVRACKIADPDLFARNAVDTSRTYSGVSTTTRDSWWIGSGITMAKLVYELESEFSQFYAYEGNYSGPMEVRFIRNSPGEAESWLLEQYGIKCIETRRKVAILRLSPVM